MTTENSNYWWLNTNTKIWDVDQYKVGWREPQETHGPEGKRRRRYSYFGEMKPGDQIVGYETTPTKRFVALYKITKGLHTSGKGEEAVEFEIIAKLDRTIGWDEVVLHPKLRNSEPVKINNRGTIFKLQPDEYNAILSLFRK